jgi:octaprenyl-diphosphate synthase
MAIETHIQAVNDLLLSIAESKVPTLQDASQHILAAGGKRLRPRLVLLAYSAAGGQDPDYVVPLAAAVEIIHTATLVHDDINDHGTLRRGRETINSRWGTTYALLTGDFLFTKTYQLMIPYSQELNTILAGAAVELVEGETLQIEASKQGTLDRDLYFEIIAKKTAALFVAAIQLGAVAAGAPVEYVEALQTYAFNLGLAFQIIDDVLDLVADAGQLGKNAGIDIEQGRGLAVALAGGSSSQGSTAASMIRAQAVAERALDMAVEKGRGKARELVAEALAALDSLPPSPAQDDLRALAHRVIERNH